MTSDMRNFTEATARPVNSGSLSGAALDERGRLLSAALVVLGRSGWWGFKVESVLKQAGLSTRSFYRHFGSKNDLLFALLEHELGAAAAALRRQMSAAQTPTEKVHTFISATIDMAYDKDLAKPSSLFAAQLRELLPDHPDQISRCYERLLEPLVAAITEGVETGELTSDDPLDDAVAVFYLVGSITADQAAAGSRYPRARIEHIVNPIISRGLGLRPRAQEPTIEQ